MPTAAASKKKTTSPEASLARLQRQLADKAAADWRSWAVAVADGGDFPDVRDLLSAATALGIPDAVVALRDDAQAITDSRIAIDNIAVCEANAAALLEPYGGRVDKLEAAIVEAKREVERLADILDRASDAPGRSFYVNSLHHTRVKHSRLWPTYNATGRAENL
jgi:hypothetical protein